MVEFQGKDISEEVIDGKVDMQLKRRLGKTQSSSKLVRATRSFVKELGISDLYLDEEGINGRLGYFVSGSEEQELFYKIIDGLSANEVSSMWQVGRRVALELVEEVLREKSK